MRKKQVFQEALMIKVWIAIGLGGCLLLPNMAFAQSCTQRLNQAEDDFEAGNLRKIPHDLNAGDCFKSRQGSFSKEEKVKAYRLLVLVHIFSDNNIEAEKAVVKLLRADPEHPISAEDPREFIYLMDKYRTTPIFRLGIKAGANQTHAKPTAEYTTSSQPANTTKHFAPMIGWGLEVTIAYELVKDLDLIGGLQYANHSYSVSYRNISDNAQDLGYKFQSNETETRNLLAFPLYARYKKQISDKLSPYLLLGASVDYLLSATLNGEATGTSQQQTSNYSLLDSQIRKRVNYSCFAGIGAKIKTTRINFLTLEFRYGLGLSNIVQTHNRFASEELLFNQRHVDDDKTLNNISVSLGYIFPIYNPKKYSDKKIKQVAKKRLRKISKKKN